MGGEEGKIDDLPIGELKEGFCNILSYQIAISNVF